MKNNKSNLANFIIGTLSEKEDSEISEVGRKLKERAFDSLLKEDDPKIEDPELAKRHKKYREHEIKGNLLQVPYDTWNSLGFYCQAKVRLCLDPLMWGGVYIAFDEFVENENKIMGDISSESSYALIKEGDRFVLLSNSSYPNIFNPSTIIQKEVAKRRLLSPILRRYSVINNYLNIEIFDGNTNFIDATTERSS